MNLNTSLHLPLSCQNHLRRDVTVENLGLSQYSNVPTHTNRIEHQTTGDVTCISRFTSMFVRRVNETLGMSCGG